LERRSDVPGFEQRIVLKDFFAAGTGGEQIQNVPNADTRAAQTRAPAKCAGSAAIRWISLMQRLVQGTSTLHHAA
jgi:hypothetical protein